MATSKRKKTVETRSKEDIVISVNQKGELSQIVEPILEPLITPPFSLDFNYVLGTKTVILPNGMDILQVMKIYTDLLDKYGVEYTIEDKPNI